MKLMAEQENKQSDKDQIRPDPMFKDITRQLAKDVGLKLLNIELPQMFRIDMAFSVPEGLDLSNTLFSFFLPFTITEFKSQDDEREVTEFSKMKSEQLYLLRTFACPHHPEYFDK
jgi:hypothetical protein